MIEIFSNTLSEEQLNKYVSLCSNNNFDETPKMDSNNDMVNYYYRKAVHVDKSIIDKSYDLIKEKNNKLKYRFTNGWINTVYQNSNLDDTFHTDEDDLTIIIYLNEDYTGGEFEYRIDNTFYQIKPKINSAIMMNNRLPHRVKNVTTGIRYSLALFFKHIEKSNKSIL